ncbi:hypothetical protein M422DRAFT_784131 [Sphaerobolus stellatus SS14]|uniref:Up-regulated during septation protein 1 domain-containing protein n=1 Tax=Sphaerobolus stellatus (strain SS14) TaxID=990650 RepID=A0A0C9UME6_SPHS4|nr:hypothetical protein M422DRAFT_784131 [Sphaerobolus stellatus SS14]
MVRLAHVRAVLGSLLEVPAVAESATHYNCSRSSVLSISILSTLTNPQQPIIIQGSRSPSRPRSSRRSHSRDQPIIIQQGFPLNVEDTILVPNPSLSNLAQGDVTRVLVHVIHLHRSLFKDNGVVIQDDTALQDRGLAHHHYHSRGYFQPSSLQAWISCATTSTNWGRRSRSRSSSRSRPPIIVAGEQRSRSRSRHTRHDQPILVGDPSQRRRSHSYSPQRQTVIMGDPHRSHSRRGSPHKDRLLCMAEVVATILVAHLDRFILREDHACIHVPAITVNWPSSQQIRAMGDMEDAQARDVVAIFSSAVQDHVRVVKVRRLLSLLAIMEIIAVMAARIRIHIRSFNVRIRGVEVPRLLSLMVITVVIVAHIHARMRSCNVLVLIPADEASDYCDPSHHGRSSSRPHSAYIGSNRPSRGRSRSPTHVLLRSDRSPSRHSRTPVSVIRRGSGSRIPSPERAIIILPSSSRASRSSRRPELVVYGDNPRQSRAPSRAHSRGPTIIDYVRGSSGRHTRPPSIYPGDPEYPDPHLAHSRPPSCPISTPHRPHSHAGSHPLMQILRTPLIVLDVALEVMLEAHVGSRAPSAYADGNRRPLSPQRNHVTTRALSEDYADSPDLRRPSRALSRAPSRVSQVPLGGESPVHVVVPTSHRTTPPFTEGNVPRDRVQHQTEYEQDRPVHPAEYEQGCPVSRVSRYAPEDRASRASHYAPEGQPTRYTWEEDAPAPTIVTVCRGISRGRTPDAHTPGTRPPSHAQATAIPSGSQPSDIHARSPDYDEADGGSRRPSRTPTEIHPDHPECDDGGGRQPSRASAVIPPDHLDYDGGSRCLSRASTVIHSGDPEYSEADGGGSRRPSRASTRPGYEVSDSRRYSRAPTVIPPEDDHLGLETPFEDRPVSSEGFAPPRSVRSASPPQVTHIPTHQLITRVPSRAGYAVSGRSGASRLSPRDAPGTHPELIHTYGDGTSPTHISPPHLDKKWAKTYLLRHSITRKTNAEEKHYGDFYEHEDNRRQTFEQNEEERKAEAEAALAELLYATRPMTPPSRPATRSAHGEGSAHDEGLLPMKLSAMNRNKSSFMMVELRLPYLQVRRLLTSSFAPSEGGVTAVPGSGPISEADCEGLLQAAEDAREEAGWHAEQEQSEWAALSEKAGSERLGSIASIAETIISERESWKRHLNDMEEERTQLLRMLKDCQQRENQEKDEVRRLEEEVVRTREVQEAERIERERVETERREQCQAEAIQRDNDLRAQLEEITNLLHEKKAECEQLKALNDERYAEKQERRGMKDSDVDALKEMVQQLIAQNDAIRNEAAEHRASLEGKPSIDAALEALNQQKQEHSALLSSMADGWRSDSQIPFNFQKYLDDFSKALSDEVKMLLAEVGNLREEKRNLQHELGYLMCMRSKYGPGGEFDPD